MPGGLLNSSVELKWHRSPAQARPETCSPRETSCCLPQPLAKLTGAVPAAEGSPLSLHMCFLSQENPTADLFLEPTWYDLNI